MNPGVSMPDSFWDHFPTWVWPIIVLGILAYFAYQAIKTFDAVAGAFGRVGRWIHGRSNTGMTRRTLRHVERIEDHLDCALTYLVTDDDWHQETDLFLQTDHPHVVGQLPHRIPFTEHQRRWREGWRPTQP